MKIFGHYVSRKYVLTWALFIVCQVLKFMGKIDDSWWALVSVGGVLGYSTVNIWQKKNDAEAYMECENEKK